MSDWSAGAGAPCHRPASGARVPAGAEARCLALAGRCPGAREKAGDNGGSPSRELWRRVGAYRGRFEWSSPT